MIMYCPSPKKYGGVGRYIDIRMAANFLKTIFKNIH